MTSGLTLAKWGRLSRGGKCDKGVPELLAAHAEAPKEGGADG